MEMEEIIESMKAPKNTDNTEQNFEVQEKREKLINAFIGGGKYLDKKINLETLNNMKDEEINKEFDKHEKKLGSVRTRLIRCKSLSTN